MRVKTIERFVQVPMNPASKPIGKSPLIPDIHQILNIARALIPITPPPRPSHPLISARHTAHLAKKSTSRRTQHRKETRT